jgi:NADP-dependent 3-hydroxy acid dehydrogenase YdfG
MSPILIPSTAVDKALDTFQTIDILINNAGIAAFGKFLELEPKAWAYHSGELNGYVLHNSRGLT